MPMRVQPLATLSEREDVFPILAVDPGSTHLLNPYMSDRKEKLSQFANVEIRESAFVVALVESVDAEFFEIDGIDQEGENRMSEC